MPFPIQIATDCDEDAKLSGKIRYRRKFACAHILCDSDFTVHELGFVFCIIIDGKKPKQPRTMREIFEKIMEGKQAAILVMPFENYEHFLLMPR